MTTTIKPQRGLDPIKPYVPGKPIEEVQREYGLTDVIKMASNENPLGVSPKVLAALHEALPHLNFYPDAQSYTLTRALARALVVEPGQITVGNGLDGIITTICMAYLGENDEAIVSRSSFPEYDIYIHAMRAILVKTPTKGFGLDLHAMRAAINERTRLVFVCNPNNPTGTMVTAAEVARFMEGLPEHVLVVFDEAYYEFVDSTEFPDSLAYVREGRKNVVVLRTYSKTYGLAGVRLGYAVAVPDILGPLMTIKEPFAVNYLAQVAGLAALDDVEFLRHTVETTRAERHFLYREFERIGVRYVESHTNFILVEIGPEAREVFLRLLQLGVIVRPGSGYDLPHCLRITIGTHEQNRRLVESLARVLAEVRGPSPSAA